MNKNALVGFSFWGFNYIKFSFNIREYTGKDFGISTMKFSMLICLSVTEVKGAAW